MRTSSLFPYKQTVTMQNTQEELMIDVLLADAEAQTTTDESVPLSSTTSNRMKKDGILTTAVDEVATEEVSFTRQDESSDQGVDAVHRAKRNGSETIYATPTGRMPRQWLFDRCDGTSKYNPESRPPCQVCWVPFVIKWCPDILEQNCVCESVGRRGCIDPENTRMRKRLFLTAFIINIIGLLLLIVTCFSISVDHFNLVRRAEFTEVWLAVDGGPEAMDNHLISWGIGLRAIAFVNGVNDTYTLYTFAELCEFQKLYHGGRLLQEDDAAMNLLVEANSPKFECNNCEDISHKIVPSLFLSMLSYIPNFTTDILRMYSNYDVNCQKFLASTFSWISLATSIYTWVNYRRGCFESLDGDPFAINEDFEKVDIDSEDAFLVVRFNWKAGLGQICLLLATLLKIVDIIINIILPTPTITRNHQEQVDYEWKYGQVVAMDTNVEPNHDEADCLRPRKTTSDCTGSSREQTLSFE